MVDELRAVEGATVRTVTVHRPDVLKNRSSTTVRNRLMGRTITNVRRRAKNAVLQVGDRWLVIQPGMTGSFHIRPSMHAASLIDYAVLRLGLADGRAVVYRDVRRLGRIYLYDLAGWRMHDDRIGPEPLDPRFSAEAFAERVGASRQAIKKVVMDQRRVAGVGNIYANEALFFARVDPARPADRLSAEEHRRLWREVRRILRKAIKAEGTTLRDYQTSNGTPGSFQHQLAVYGRGGEPCRRCRQPLAATHEIDMRQTVWCRNCQS